MATKREQKVTRFNARIAATIKRLAQEAPKKQDPSKTMMGEGWSKDEVVQAQKMVGEVKDLIASLDGTAGPLLDYAAKVSPDKIKQLGHLVSFVHTTKPVVDKLAKIVASLQSALKAYS